MVYSRSIRASSRSVGMSPRKGQPKAVAISSSTWSWGRPWRMRSSSARDSSTVFPTLALLWASLREITVEISFRPDSAARWAPLKLGTRAYSSSSGNSGSTAATRTPATII